VHSATPLVKAEHRCQAVAVREANKSKVRASTDMLGISSLHCVCE
jgi:hypothetical protein